MNFDGQQFGMKDLTQRSDNTQVNNIRRPIQKVKYNYVPMSYSDRIKLANQKYKDDNSLFSGNRLLNRTKELGKIIKTPAATLAASATAVASPTVAARLLTGATSAVGFGGLGVGSGNSVKDAIYGAAGEVILPIASKAIGAGLDAVKSVGSNYRDMENLNKFAEIYTYDKPKANIFSSKSVDKVYKDLLNQHNTFARGVSTSYKTFQNPDIVDALKAAKVYDPKIPLSEQSKDIARYMATNIPRRTGYGRAGLDELDNGLYVSNSYNTAKGYTYGDGYIATIRRPVDYSSKNRKDWLRSGDFVASPLDDNSFGAFKTERDLLNEKYRKESNNEFIKQLERYTDLEDYILKRKNYDIDGGDLSGKMGLKISKQSELLNNALYKKLETLPSDIKFGIDESPLIKEVFSRGPNKRIVKTNGNPYQHFIIRGNAGSQPVELIDLQPFTGGADDFTRQHIGNYSEGLSKKSFNFPITYK